MSKASAKAIKRRGRKSSCDTTLLSSSLASDSCTKKKERKTSRAIRSENPKKPPTKPVTSRTVLPCSSDMIDNHTHIDETILVNDPPPKTTTKEVPRSSPASLPGYGDEGEERKTNPSPIAVAELSTEAIVEHRVCRHDDGLRDIDQPHSEHEASRESSVVSGGYRWVIPI